jgi:predicted transcriptional regulator
MIADTQRRTSQIVAAYVRKNLVSTDQIAGLINSVHSTLSGLGNQVVEEPPRVPAVSVRRSVRPDHIICIDCGYKGKMLKRHLQSRHGLSVIQYKHRWNLSSDYPMTAPNYSEQRAQFAKKIGLGRGPAQPAAIPATASASEATPEKPARRRSASKAARSRTSAKKANTKTSARKASPMLSAKKASATTSAKKASATTSGKKASATTSAKKASNRSRKPSTRASKAASAPEAATA